MSVPYSCPRLLVYSDQDLSTNSPGDVNCFASADEQVAFFSGTIEVNGIEQSGNFTDPFDIQTLLAQASQMQQKYEELGKRCLEQPAGKYLRYVGTAATARDVAALADALDGPGSSINYIGLSYGTLLGSWLVNSEFSHFQSSRYGRV